MRAPWGLQQYATVALLLSLATFLPGLLGPSFRVDPSIGDDVLDAWFLLYWPAALESRSFSIISGIRSLYQGGDYGLASSILLFSVLFPVIKLTLLSVLCIHPVLQPQRMLSSRVRSVSVAFLSYFGAWSMLDVLVVAIIVVGSKEFVHARIQREWGIICFAASVLFSMVSAAILKRSAAH